MSSRQPSEITNKTEPWSEQKPYLQDVFAQAQNLYQQGPPAFYGGQLTADQSAATQAAQQAATANAATAQALANNTAAASQFGLTGALDVNNNQYLSGAVDAATRSLGDNFTRNVLPNIGSQAQLSGAYGGARHGFVEAQTANDYMQNVRDMTATMYSDAYGKGLDTYAKTLALSPQIQAMQGFAPQMLGAVGAQQDAYAQQLINDQIQAYNYNANAPWLNLANYQNMVQGNFGGTSTSTNPNARPGLLQGLGGVLGGAQMGMMFGGPVGAGIGGLLGAASVFL